VRTDGEAAVGKLFAGLIFALPLWASAASTDVEVAARVDRTDLTVGDVVHYDITVTHPENGRIDLPAVRGNVGHFEVQNARVTPGRAVDGRVTVTYAFTLTSYTLGTDTLPAQRVEFRAGTDTAALVLYTPPTVLAVRRVSPANAREIADITDPEKMPRTVPWGLIALAAAAVVFWIYREWRQRHPRKPPAAARAPLTPDQEALERLRALEQAGLASQGLGREFAFTLSEILRAYIGARFEIDALEATTEELLQRAAALPLEEAQREWLRRFTSDLDTVKFATGALAVAEAARQIESAREFVQTTRPVQASAEVA
jgi:hypothetical protein